MAAIYTPPKLPSYLANSFDLKPVTGVPSDDEVKMIHAAIRTVECVSHVSVLCDPGLSMDLAQHLFDVQMVSASSGALYYIARITLVQTNTYTPPALPSHINVSLAPVTGAPSDDEVKLVHNALRVSEDLANARYIQQSIEGQYSAQDASPGTRVSREINSADGSGAPIEAPEVTVGAATDFGQLGSEHQDNPLPHSSRSSSCAPAATAALSKDARGIIKQLKANLDQTDRRLVEMRDVLKDELNGELNGGLNGLKNGLASITRLMIKLHNHSARGFNSNREYAYHHIVDENGEAPLTRGLPYVQNGRGFWFWHDASSDVLAAFLQYYHIGMELVEQGDTPTLKPDSTEQAKEILASYTHNIFNSQETTFPLQSDRVRESHLKVELRITLKVAH
ncbi:hypothetical protein BDV93DRAFT_549470 [Ceratobasidium sp. AG-I]|nr:hypothetical protein BDV93DRAFT_549470 [Ceratobasidium sp. AG-I]